MEHKDFVSDGTMTLTEQMFSDFGKFWKPEYVQERTRSMREEMEVLGEVIRIIETWDGEDLIERRYRCAIGGGFFLDGSRASEDNTLNRLINPAYKKETRLLQRVAVA